MDKNTVRAAFRQASPVMAGYIVLGMGFGVLLADQGYHWIWAAFHVLPPSMPAPCSMPRWISSPAAPVSSPAH